VSLQKQKMRLEKRPRGTAGAAAGAEAKRGARSVRAREVFGGDDTDSDGDEAPRAEEEAAVADAVDVKAEPAPALEPVIKREPSDSRRQQWQRQQQQRPTCVRSAKRHAVSARGGAGGPRVRVEAEEAAAVGAEARRADFEARRAVKVASTFASKFAAPADAGRAGPPAAIRSSPSLEADRASLYDSTFSRTVCRRPQRSPQ
jgi:hypothetical protein